MLNLARLQLFHELSVLGTISGVAKATGLTRPAVSQQLAQLERETGVALFERSVRGARLTTAGHRLLARVNPLFTIINDIEADLVDTGSEVRGEVRVAAFGSVATTIVPRAVSSLLKAHPAIEFVFNELEPADGLKATAAKQVDLAIVDDLTEAAPYRQILEFYPLCVDYLGAVLSADHRFAVAGKKTVDLKELALERWAMNQAAISYQSYIVNACLAAGFEVKAGCSARNIAATLEMVRTGHFVTVLPALALHAIKDDPDFLIIPITPALSRRIFVAVQKGTSKRPAIAAALSAFDKASSWFEPSWQP